MKTTKTDNEKLDKTLEKGLPPGELCKFYGDPNPKWTRYGRLFKIEKKRDKEELTDEL